jgi:hypothetical protein
MKDWSQLTEPIAQCSSQLTLQNGIPMAPASSTLLIPEVFEGLKLHSCGTMLIPRNRKSITPIASKIHEGTNALMSLGIEVPVFILNPSMVIGSPKIGTKQTMGKVGPIVTLA